MPPDSTILEMVAQLCKDYQVVEMVNKNRQRHQRLLLFSDFQILLNSWVSCAAAAKIITLFKKKFCMLDNTSIQCTSCQKWVQRKCSGIKGSMYKVMKPFVCRGCVNPVTGTGRASVDIGVNANLESLNKFVI